MRKNLFLEKKKKKAKENLRFAYTGTNLRT